MLKIYNTLSGKKEDLKPLRGKQVNFFVCGPTVYDASHIGHARTYVFFDVAVKYLRYSGCNVFYLQNITDIDDKIIARAHELGQNPLFLSRHYVKEYFQDMNALKITAVSKFAPATKFIPQIIAQIERLVKRGYAYEIPGDGYYFSIKKFPRYGKLSGRTAAAADDAVSRIDESVKKRNKGDFCLWKFAKSGEPSWKSPFGKGRPGWHIEDTAISEHFFGPQYDIHGGGVDLKFPHHESEIAQQESASSKKPFVKYWLHTGHLRVSGTKMSKSLKNFITIHDMLKKHSTEAFRLLILQNHYRSPLNYTDVSIRAAEEGIKRITEFLNRLWGIKKDSRSTKMASAKISKLPNELLKKFKVTMDNDFDTPKVIAMMFDFIKKTNRLIDQNRITKKEAGEILAVFKKIDSILGIIPKKNAEAIPQEIIKLAEKREQYRKGKKWTEADIIRNEIRKKGFLVEDSPSGPIIKKAGA